MHHHLLQDAESSTRELGSRWCFQVTRGRGATGVSSYFPTYQGWQHTTPSEPLNQDMDAQLRYLLVMLSSGPALQIIRQQPSGVQALRDLARRHNQRSQARSLAQLQEIMHF